MKKTIYLLLFTLTLTRSHSQVGVIAGVNLDRFEYYSKSVTIGGNKTSFHAGITYRHTLKPWLAVQSSLMYSVRGGTIHDVDSTINTVISNIELPVDFLYVYKKLSLGAGPRFCYGVVGQLKSNGHTSDAYNTDESFERTIKRFELCADVMIAYQLRKRIMLTASYSPGLSNIYKGDGSAPPDVKARTSVFGISVIFTPSSN